MIEKVQGYNERVLVVVICGSAVICPWLDSSAATLFLFYAGSEAGRALGDILCGETEPGGRLPFTIPTQEEDLVPFERDATSFRYDLLHGQWKLDAENSPAHRPFGYGLGYTTFEINEAEADGGGIRVDITNTGSRSGSTVVQVYGSVPGSEHLRAPKRLVGFTKVKLGAGEKKTLQIPVDERMLDLRIDGKWQKEQQPIRLAVGFDAASARPV